MKKINLYSMLVLMVTFTSAAYAQQAPQIEGLSQEQRELYIQKAIAFRELGDYGNAISFLDSILIRNSADAPALLFKGDLLLQANRFGEAAGTYSILLPLNHEPTITKINLSYALFMNHKPAKALEYAKKAWEENKLNTSAIVNYFNAMLWNQKTKEAEKFLFQEEKLLTPAQNLVLKARLYTTSGNYNSGLKLYDSLVNRFPDKYYVQEYADVLLGKKEIALSASTMDSARLLFSAKEFEIYEGKLKATKQQSAGNELQYFSDVAKNIRIENSIWWQQSEARKYRLRLSAGHSSIRSGENEKTTAQFGHIHMDERWSKAWSGQTDIRLQVINPGSGEKFSGITGQQTIQYQPNDRRMMGVFYSSEILNFTASLLGNNIRSNNAGYLLHIMPSGKTGFYSQGSAGFLSDQNRRYQFFGSFYQLFRTEPTLKAGINFSALHYADSTIKYYFSPNRYLNTEVFADFSTPLPLLSKWYLQTQAAAGVQQIEKNDLEPAIRFQTEIGLRLKHIETALKYQTSNVASSNGTGYKFNWLTLRLLVKW